MQSVKEGKAQIVLKPGVFYNPKMKGLRDLSVLFLRAMKIGGYSLLDATAATGVRGIRYRLEAKAGKVTFLDLNKSAYLSTKANLKRNKMSGVALNKNIQEFCNTTKDHFDVIDLDPFGSAAPYIYDLMKLAKEGTVLMATATDTAVLCGAMPLACYKTYAAMPLHNELCHEVGIRILINYIAKAASQFNFGIEVKLAIANLHYMRAFLTLRHGAKEAVASVKENGFGSFCSKCRNFGYKKGLAPNLGNRCSNCKSQMQLFGPLWLGSIYDKKLVSEMRRTAPASMDRDAFKLVSTINGELDTPFFYSIPKMTRQLGVGSVAQSKVTGLLEKKNEVSKTHFDGDGIKTDGSVSEIKRAILAAHHPIR